MGLLMFAAIFLLGTVVGCAFGVYAGEAIADERREREDEFRLSDDWLKRRLGSS
ncbi:MAG TPA: hypothetical protein VN083_12130 [Vicinamibacteria bacterium]|jgi:hypothetical protein|nr:hypothetical protein [Vicinamibacteria bacterium]